MDKLHKAVNYNEKAIQKVIDKNGYIYAGEKQDGIRCRANLVDGVVKFLTYEHNEIRALAPFVDAFTRHWPVHGDVTLDFEVWISGLSFEESSGILRRHDPIDTSKNSVIFMMIDVFYQGDSLDPFSHRALNVTRIAERLIKYIPTICKERLAKCGDIGSIKDLYQFGRANGLEGLVLKDPECGVRSGKVAGMWKVKPGCGAEWAPGWEGDGKIIAPVWGDEDKSNAGKVVGWRVLLEDGTEVNCTGLTQQQIDEFTADPDAYTGRYCEVNAMERTKYGSLRHPHFKGLRDLDYAKGIKC